MAAALGLALVAAACGGNGDTDTTEGPTRLRIAFVPATTGLLLNVAQEKGFFRENGLDVTLTPAANISDIIPALGRQFEISLGTATDLVRATDLGVVQISGNTIDTEDNPFVRLIVRPDSGIGGIADLAGKRVASPTLSGVIHVATLFWSKREGVDPSSISGVQVPPPNLPDQLTSGQVDAVEALEPFASQLVANGNISLGDPFAAIGLPLATNFWIANGDWARRNADVVATFRRSLEQALEFLEDNEAEARMILQGFTEMPAQVAERVPLPTFDLEIRVQDLATWIDVLGELGEDVGEVDPEELVVDGGE